MSNFPDFSQHGYQIISQLGENHLGGRVTYLAERQTSATQTSKVVIKQFQFAQMGATWAEYDAYSQEITMLRQLNHPAIAKYIDAFQTPVRNLSLFTIPKSPNHPPRHQTRKHLSCRKR
jgi:serine/threonine protein kinase